MPVTTSEVFLARRVPTTPRLTVPHPAIPPALTTPAVRATRAEATVGEAVTVVEAEATSGPRGL